MDSVELPLLDDKLSDRDIMTRPLGAINPHGYTMPQVCLVWQRPTFASKPANVASHPRFALMTVIRPHRFNSKRR